MVRSRWCWGSIIIFIVALSKSHSQDKVQSKEKDVDLSPEFMTFVKSLESKVFHSERHQSEVKSTKPTVNTLPQRTPNQRYYYDDKLKPSQTAAIRDILMLKLVSYYEDKYNVAGTTLVTTPQMLEPMKDRRRVDEADFIEQIARQHEARKSASSDYAEVPTAHLYETRKSAFSNYTKVPTGHLHEDRKSVSSDYTENLQDSKRLDPTSQEAEEVVVL